MKKTVRKVGGEEDVVQTAVSYILQNSGREIVCMRVSVCVCGVCVYIGGLVAH